MFRSCVFTLLGIVALACVATDQCRFASAHSVAGWPPKEIKSTGKTWGVYMKQAKFENLAEKGMLVAEADSEEEAKQLSDAYFKHPKNKFPHDLFEVHKRDNSKSDGSLRTLSFDMPGGQKLVVPLSNVDPKPIPTAKPPVIDLKGKAAKGKLGQYAVTFEFKEGNKLAISGEAVGEGEWGLAGDQLTMTTESSVFLGAVDKDGKMKGKRVKRDGKDLLEWNASLTNSKMRYGIEQRWRTKASDYKSASTWSEWHRNFFYRNDEHDNQIDCEAEVKKRIAEAATDKLYDREYRVVVLAYDRKPDLRNLIVNGSFEDGPEIYGDEGDGLSEDYGYLPLDRGATDIPGWVVTRGQIDVHANHVNAIRGRRSIDLNGSPGVGGVRQSVTTERGKKYILKFIFSGHPGAVEAYEPEKVLGLDIGNTTKTFRFDTTGHTKASMGWVEKEVAFIATEDKTTIEFYSLSKLDRYCGPAIDDVRVHSAD